MSLCCAGRASRNIRGSANKVVLTSLLTVAGGAAMWGLLVLSAHLLWPSPRRGLPATATDLADSETVGDLTEANLLKVVTQRGPDALIA